MAATLTISGAKPDAKILLDGEDFIDCYGDDYLGTFAETLERADELQWREVALYVWKPRHGVYLRERLVLRGGAK